MGGAGFLIQRTAAARSLRLFSFLREGPKPPRPAAPWHDAQLAANTMPPWAASPPGVAIEPAVAGLLATAATELADAVPAGAGPSAAR